jgi:hypothetical protein
VQISIRFRYCLSLSSALVLHFYCAETWFGGGLEDKMNRIRRPWPVSRRDTDGVQLNTLDENGRTEAEGRDAAKKIGFDEATEPVDHEHGHMQEIEVDVAHVLQDREVKDIEEDTSPYPEVRAVVPETDDPDIPVNTLRMWLLGVVWTLIGAGVNQFFSLRYPAVHIVSIVAELLAYPMGVALAHILPIVTLDLGWFGKWNIVSGLDRGLRWRGMLTGCRIPTGISTSRSTWSS